MKIKQSCLLCENLSWIHFKSSFVVEHREPSQWGTLGTYVILRFISVCLSQLPETLICTCWPQPGSCHPPPPHMDLPGPHPRRAGKTDRIQGERKRGADLFVVLPPQCYDGLNRHIIHFDKSKGLLMRNLHSTVWTHSWWIVLGVWYFTLSLNWSAQ